jgi:predicted  nucleic acid-binding Zn-ribbon protein
VSTLELLLAVQERDLALDRLRHRRATLPERAALAEAEIAGAALRARIAELAGPRDALATEQRKHEDEAQSLSQQAAAVEKRMYSGEVSSPRELQAMQADVEQLRRHQATVEERAIDAMERYEPLQAEVTELEQALAGRNQDADAARTALAAAEAVVDAELVAEAAARAEAVTRVGDAALVTDYERRRVQSKGQGAARLVGNTCQSCHLTIPATEVDRIRHAPDGIVAYCDNCGAILIP